MSTLPIEPLFPAQPARLLTYEGPAGTTFTHTWAVDGAYDTLITGIDVVESFPNHLDQLSVAIIGTTFVKGWGVPTGLTGFFTGDWRGAMPLYHGEQFQVSAATSAGSQWFITVWGLVLPIMDTFTLELIS